MTEDDEDDENDEDDGSDDNDEYGDDDNTNLFFLRAQPCGRQNTLNSSDQAPCIKPRPAIYMFFGVIDMLRALVRGSSSLLPLQSSDSAS